MLHLALPIALQQLVWASLGMVSMIMVGQLGDVSVAAVGLGNQVFFLLTLVLFGINSGSAMFTAQMWGKGDLVSIRKVMAVGLSLSLMTGVIFLVVALLIPQVVLGIFSRDPAVIAAGSEYLRIFSLAFIFTAVTFSFAAILRSTGEVRTPIIINMAALAFNTALSYILIFGLLGLPEMGLRGAAWAIVISRLLECSALLFVTYWRRLPAAVTLRDASLLRLPFILSVLIPMAPVVLNELLWSLGITAYNVVYARINTESIAAMNIVGTIDNLALVAFVGLANACAILVGNRIGAGEEALAQRYAGRTLVIGAAGALLVGALIFLGSGFILSLYNVSAQVIAYAQRVLVIVSSLLWLRMSNLVLFIGIFRAGGDARFAFLLDAVIIWTVGVPLALFGAFVLDLPVYWVYLLVMTEELAKWSIGLGRFFSRRWIHNLAQAVG
jgi:putative MATE family efflux protein